MLKLSFLRQMFFPQICLLCKQTASDVVCESCFNCLTLQLNTDKSTVTLDSEYDYYYLLPYSKDVKFLLTQLKFNKNLIVNRIFKQLISQWANEINADFSGEVAITAVPIHRLRYLYRGFNQSEILANHIAKSLDTYICHSMFTRDKYTKAQAKSTKAIRHKQIKGVFGAKERFEIEHLIVFDDVLTTGSTLSEFIRVIKQECKVGKITVISLTNASIS